MPVMARECQELRVSGQDGVEVQVSHWPGDGPAVIGLHGLTANRLAFLPLLEALPRSRAIVSLDARGRGRSDKPEEASHYGHRKNADDAAAVLRALGQRQAVVVGHSMGAWVGLQLAARHPDLVAALVLVDGGYFLDLPEGVPARAHVDAVLGAGWDERLSATVPSMEVAMAAFRAHPALGPLWSDALANHLREGFEEADDGTVRPRCSRIAAVADALDYFEPGGELPYVRADLPLVHCPVRLLCAETGLSASPETMAPVLSDAACESFQRELPSLTVERLSGTNHFSIAYGARGIARTAELIDEVSAAAGVGSWGGS